MSQLSVAVIGIGNIGNAHAKCINSGEIENLKLTAVCDINADKLEEFSNFSDVKVYTDYKKLISDKVSDAVIIAVPHPLHAEIAIYALENGLNVLVEKPVDITVSKAKELNAVAEKSGKVFAIMFNQRTDPIFRKAREIIKNGELGKLIRSVWIITNWYRTQHYYNSGSWRATWKGEGGGVLLNQAPHNLDLWQWICGMPDSITAFCDESHFHNIEVEDNATIIANYKNGAIGTFITSTGEYPGTNRLEISGELGKIILENGILKWWKLKESNADVSKNSNKSSNQIEYDYIEIKDDMGQHGHKSILKNFTNAILFGEELISPGIEGINQITITNAAYLSQWKGNAKIDLPFDTKEYDKLLSEKIAKSSYNPNAVVKISSGKYSDRWKVNW